MTTASHLERFVPGHVLARLEKQDRLVTEVEGTLCFVDISGFTALSERLAAKGRVGAEELTEVLSRVFGDMLELVAERGGTLLKFGGDALLVLFEGPEHAMQAACAAVEMRAALRRTTEIPTSVGKVVLRMSVGLHSGPVHLFRLSGTHRELIVAGPAASHVNLMEGTADAGEILVSAATRDLLPGGAADSAKGDGWLLKWRTSKATACGVPIHFDDGVAVPENYMPTALRAHLEAGAPDSEHRLATVLFVKVLGIDDHIAEVGADVTARALQELVANVTAIADEQEVTFLATDVDANAFKIILVAGVPSTSLDEDGKALRAARRISDLVTPFAVKIGVNRGHVFAGEVGTIARSTYTIMGDTVNLAARMMAAAPPGSIYASPEVVSGSTTLFDTQAIPPFDVKGKSEPVHARDVGDELGVRGGHEARETSFVGRQIELQVLSDAVEALTRGGGRAVAVTGPTGIGKTRMVEEALVSSDLDALAVRAEPYGAANPYRPFRDAVRSLLGIERGTNEAMAGQLLHAVGSTAPELLPLAPLLGDIAQVDVPPTESSEAIDPRFRQDRAIDVVVTLLGTMYPDGLIIVGEDMHWADAASEAMISRLVRETTTRPWLVIQTCRNRIEQPEVETIWLEPLDHDDTRALVHAASEATPFRPDVVDAIVARSGGNPLFVLELAKAARTTGEVDSLPTSLDGVIGSQIDRLEPLSRRVLGYLSVLGRSFRVSVARELLESEGVELDEATRERLADFLEEDGPERLQFRHALVRDTAYEGLPYRRRRALHLRAGEMIMEAMSDDVDAVADILGLHFYLGGDAERAWHYCRIAGDRNKERFANPEAAAQYERALDAAHGLTKVSDVDRRTVLLGLGDALQLAGDLRRSLAAYKRTMSLSRNDVSLHVEVLLRRARAKERMGTYSAAIADVTRAVGIATAHGGAASRWRAEALSQAAVIRQAQQRPRDALESARLASAAAADDGVEAALARSWAVMDWAYHMLGRPEEATYSEGALSIYKRIGELDSAASVSMNLGGFSFLAGKWNRALEYYDAGLHLAERAGNAVEVAVAMSNIGELLVFQGRLDEAEPVLEDARRVFGAAGFADSIAFVDLQLGKLHALRGDLRRAQSFLDSAIDEADRLGLAGFAFESRLYLADATCRAGRPREALSAIDEAVRSAPKDYAELYAPLAARIRGTALARLHRDEEAVDVLETGLAAAHERSETYEAAMIAVELESLRPSTIAAMRAADARETLRTLGVRSAS